MKIMYVQPIGGICNRMRVIASAYEVSKKNNKRMVLFWEKNEELNCDYKSLFELPKDIIGVNYDIKKKCIKNRLVEYAKRTNMNSHTYYENKIVLSAVKEEKKYCDIYFQSNNIYVKTEYGLKGSDEESINRYNYTIFKINSNIIKKVPEIIKNNSCIGIHIRRTDNKKSIERSPIELFYKAIDNEITNGKELFFLATDSYEIKKEMKKKYGNAIIFRESILNRNSKQGIVDSMVELASLSLCEKIYGSYYSSFSKAAAHLGNIPLITCKKE